MQINPYLNFRGNALEAMTFYQSVLGGELRVTRFADVPMPGSDPAEADLVMHSQLNVGDTILLMGSDSPERIPYQPGVGQFSVSISGSEVETLAGHFAALSEGGTVTMPWSEPPWGGWFGMFIDRFGVSWLINAG